MSIDINKVLERLQAQLGAQAVELCKRDVLIEQLEAQLAERATEAASADVIRALVTNEQKNGRKA